MSTKYDEYLKTDYWKAVSDAVKKRAGWRCQTCNSQHDLVAHHRCYDHRGYEMNYLDDLTCLCSRCHKLFHGRLPVERVVKPKRPKKTSVAPKPQAPVENEELVQITYDNYKRLRCTKEPWHWMKKVGIDPTVSGWAKRAIGHFAPKRFLR